VSRIRVGPNPDEIATYALRQRVFQTYPWIRREKGCEDPASTRRLNSIDGLRKIRMNRIVSCVIAALALVLSACTNPYDPVQRGFAGGLWGAASGAAIGAAAGGGPGAALGAAVGGATGIFGGVATTPPPPPGTYYGYPTYGYPPYGYPAYPYPAYGYPAYGYPGHGYPAYPQPGYGYPAYPDASGYAGLPYGYQGDAGYRAHSGSPSYEYPSDLGHPAYRRSPSHEVPG